MKLGITMDSGITSVSSFLVVLVFMLFEVVLTI